MILKISTTIKKGKATVRGAKSSNMRETCKEISILQHIPAQWYMRAKIYLIQQQKIYPQVADDLERQCFYNTASKQ